MADNNTALKDLYNEYNPKLNLARSYSEFEQTMKDPNARKDFYDSFNSELKLANSYNEFESVLGMSSPKSAEPSTKGGKSGSVKPQTPPLTSTSASDVTKLGSLGQQILPQSLGGTVKQPQAQPQAAKEPTTPVLKTEQGANKYLSMALGYPHFALGTYIADKILDKILPEEPKTPVLKTGKEPTAIPKSYAPTIQENIAKIEGITFKTKFPEYSQPKKTEEPFDFKKASAQAISEEEKARQQEKAQRIEQRRIQNIPKEIEQLKQERNELILDRSSEGRKKLAANEAVTRNYEKQLEEANKLNYTSLENLNKNAVKGLQSEIYQYLLENPKELSEVQARKLSETETYALIQKAVSKKVAPLEQDLQTFQKEGTIALAAEKINASKLLQSKQTEIQGIGEELKTYQDSYLKKNGLAALTEQYSQAKKRLDSYSPVIQKIKGESVAYNKELQSIKERIDSYASKIEGNKFNGTQAELDEYNSLIKEYNETFNELNNLSQVKYKDELSGYDNAVTNYNSILAKRNSVVQGLQNTEYNKMTARYEAALTEYNGLLDQYKKYEEPAVKDRINKYFSTVGELNKYDNKLKEAKGAMPSIEELEKAQKSFEQTGLGGDILDFGGRAVNSIVSTSQKFIAFPFRLASTLEDVSGKGNVYHFSDYMADLIEQKGKQPLFMTKRSNDLYDVEKDSLNLGFFPILNSAADQAGLLLLFALTGRYATPAMQSRIYSSTLETGGVNLEVAAAEAESIAHKTMTILPSFLISYGDNYKSALEKGFSPVGAMAFSGTMSYLEGWTEMLIPNKELIFGKGVKETLLREFIKDYAKGSKYATKRLVEGFTHNLLGEATEEYIGMSGEAILTTLGHLMDRDIEVEVPTINQVVSTGISSGFVGGGMGIIGQISDEKKIYQMGVSSMAKDFDNAKTLLAEYNKRGYVSDKKYEKLITDVQKYQAVSNKIPQGLSQFKTVAIAEKMIAINELYSQMDKDEKNPINKINKKKINSIQDEIEKIIDDKEFDKKYAEELNQEGEELRNQMTPEIDLKRYTGGTPQKYGYIDRGDGKGKVELTQEEFEAEQAKMQPKAKEEVIGDEEFAEFEKNKSVTPERISAIAEKINNGEKLSTRENKIVAYKKAEIKAELEKKGLESQQAETATEEAAVEQPTTTEQVKEQPKVEPTIEQPTTEVPETKVTPVSNPTVVITGLRSGFETLSSNNLPQGKLEDIGRNRAKDFDKDGILIDTDSEGNKTLYIKVGAVDSFGRDGNMTVQIKIPKGSEINQAAIKKIVDEQVERMKSKDNPELQLNKVSKSDFDGLKDALVKEIENPTIEKAEPKAETQPTTTEQVEEKPKPTEKPKTKEEIAAEIERLKKEKQEELDSPKKYSNYESIGDIEKINTYKFNKGLLVGIKTETGAMSLSGVSMISEQKVKEIEQKNGEKAALDYIKNQLVQQEKNRIDRINAKYDSQIAELEKQYEQETKKENGEPLSGGVQGVRTEGEGGQESTELRAEKEKVKPTETGGVANADELRKTMAEEINSQISAKENELIEKQKKDIEDAKNDLIAIENGDKSVIDKYIKKSGYKLITKEVIAKNPKSELLKKNEGKYYYFSGASVQVKTAQQIAIDAASKKANSKPQGSSSFSTNKYVDVYNAITKFSQGKITAEEAKNIIEKAGLKIPKAIEQSLQSTPTTEEKVSGGLTQEEKTNLETIAKEAGVNFQEVRNVYNKYGEGKPLSEITLEDYQKAQEKRDKGKEAKTEEGAPTITVEEEKQKPQLPKTRKERLDSLREKAKKLKGAKPVSSAVGAVMTKAREALNWIKQKAGVKETKISERNPLLTEAAKRLKNGEITNEEYRAILNENSPIAPITTFFDPATGQQVETSVDASKRKNANKPVASGTRVGLRIDIPAFRNNNIWVVSVHDGLKKAGEILSYKNAARITNVVFGTQSPKASLEIAAGGQKTAMVGRIFGDWNDLEGKTEEEKGETAKKLVEEIVNDPSWVQVGMNPFRQSYFYDRSSQLGRPVLSADEVVQIGGLVYAKNVKYGNWTDEAFRVKGLLDKAGKPVQFSKGKRMSDVENFISSSIEEGYPLDEVSEIVQEVWGKSEAEANKLIDKYKPTKTTKNAVQEPSTERKVSSTGEGRKDITEGGEGVGQGKQGEKVTQEGVQEKIDALVDKSLPASERRKIMQENPLIKRIFDNIKELHKQLEEKGLITKEGNCP